MSKVKKKLQSLGLFIDDSKLDDFLAHMDIDKMTELADACDRGNRDAIMKIVLMDENDSDNLHDVEDDSEKEKPHIISTSEVTFGEGDDVDFKYNNENFSGKVKIPNGPAETVGVMKDGKMVMVDKSDVHLAKPKNTGEAVNEAVQIEMDEVNPSLVRLTQLAGLSGYVSQALPQIDPTVADFDSLLTQLEGKLKTLTIDQYKMFASRIEKLYI